MRMTWSELLFAHWQVEPEAVSRWLPKGLQVDTRDGKAWVGVVPFLMTDVSPRFCPALPWLSRFLELNVRTYVLCDGKPGVWFFSLDAANPVAVRVARKAFHLPYMDASMSSVRNSDGQFLYKSERTHRGEPPARLEATYRSVGESFRAQPGTLEHWLTARYCLYSSDRRGRLYRGEIDHEPWQLTNAEWSVTTNTMGKPLDFDLSADPHLLYAQPIRVRGWIARPCSR